MSLGATRHDPGGPGRPPSQKSLEFLSKYRLHGAGLTVGDFCRAHGYHLVTYRRWRITVKGFAETFDQLREAHQRDHRSADEKQMTQYGLSEQEAKFLRHYRESCQQTFALGMTEWDGNRLKEAMANPIFRREIESIEQEIAVKVKDAVIEKARKGSLGHARLFLEQADPERYGKRAASGKKGGAAPNAANLRRRADHWGTAFGRAAAEAAPVTPSPRRTEPEESDGDSRLAPN